MNTRAPLKSLPLVPAMVSVITLNAGIARAQSDEDAGPRALEEVTVTASKRGVEETLQNVPFSIQAITDEQIERTGVQSFEGYARSVPSLSFVQRAPNSATFVMRGVSTGDIRGDDPQNHESVGMYVDEVPVAVNGFNPDVSLFDLARIEVLRGPQGTLYGAGAMSGAIRLITNQPNVSRSESRAQLTASSTRFGGINYGINALVNTPLIEDKLAIRLVGHYRNMDGFIDNVLFDDNDANTGFRHGNGENINTQEDTAARLALRYEPTDRLAATFTVFNQVSNLGGSFMENEPLGELEQAAPLEAPTRDELSIFNVVLEYDLGAATLTSSTAYTTRDKQSRADLNQLVTAVFGVAVDSPITNTTDIEDIHQELRLASSGSGRLNWVAGAYYNTQDRLFTQDLAVIGFEELTGINLDEFGSSLMFEGDTLLDLEQKALFGEVTYEFAPNWRATLGLRWFDMSIESDIRYAGLFQGGVDRQQLSNTESGYTPKFNLSYQATPDVLMYAQAAQGFRLGGTNDIVPLISCGEDLAELGLAGGPRAFDSDGLWNYEVGTKSRWLGGRLLLNSSVYHIDWTDIQTNAQLRCGFGFIENAGAAEVDGVELEMRARTLAGLEVSIGGSYTNARLSEPAPNLGGNTGDHMPFVPKYGYNASLHYEREIGSGAMGFAHFDYQHVDSSSSRFDPATGVPQPAYDIGNFRVGLQFPRWTLSLFVDNVWDERAALKRDISLFSAAPGIISSRNRPRTIGLSLRWEI